MKRIIKRIDWFVVGLLGLRPVGHGDGWVEAAYADWWSPDLVELVLTRIRNRHARATGLCAQVAWSPAARRIWLWDARGESAVQVRIAMLASGEA